MQVMTYSRPSSGSELLEDRVLAFHSYPLANSLLTHTHTHTHTHIYNLREVESNFEICLREREISF